MYCIRVKNQSFLLVFGEDGLRQMNYRFPGTQRKAWCTAFDRDLKTESAWSAGEVCPISAIVKRRDIREPGDVFLAQRANASYHMSAYLCPLDLDDTAAGVSNQIVTKLNEYAANPRNNMKMFRFVKETRMMKIFMLWTIGSLQKTLLLQLGPCTRRILKILLFMSLKGWLMVFLKGLKMFKM